MQLVRGAKRLFLSPSPRFLYLLSALGGACIFWLVTRSNVSVASIQRLASVAAHKSTTNTDGGPPFPFPKKIWQTGPPIDSTRDNSKSIASWSRLNPDFRYEFLTDLGAEQYVLSKFSNNSKILDTYNHMSDVILRADLLRLLLMWRSGGVYSDIDTNCLRPILDWIPEEFYTRTRVVVGIEIDLSEDDVSDDEKKHLQLCQWTLMAAPGNILFERVIDMIIKRIEQVAEEKKVSISDLGNHISIPEVISITGPHAFTNALFESLSISLGEPITSANVSGLRTPRLINDVLFLPVNAFGGHQWHSHSGESSRGPRLIQHHFASSWWKAKSHP